MSSDPISCSCWTLKKKEIECASSVWNRNKIINLQDDEDVINWNEKWDSEKKSSSSSNDICFAWLFSFHVFLSFHYLCVARSHTHTAQPLCNASRVDDGFDPGDAPCLIKTNRWINEMKKGFCFWKLFIYTRSSRLGLIFLIRSTLWSIIQNQ